MILGRCYGTLMFYMRHKVSIFINCYDTILRFADVFSDHLKDNLHFIQPARSIKMNCLFIKHCINKKQARC